MFHVDLEALSEFRVGDPNCVAVCIENEFRAHPRPETCGFVARDSESVYSVCSDYSPRLM